MGCPKFFITIIFLVSISIAFLFLFISHFPSFLYCFTFWTSIHNSSWSSRMRSSFVNIHDLLNHGVLLGMPYLWSLDLTIAWINLSSYSIILPSYFTFMRQVASNYNLFCSCWKGHSRPSTMLVNLPLSALVGQPTSRADRPSWPNRPIRSFQLSTVTT